MPFRYVLGVETLTLSAATTVSSQEDACEPSVHLRLATGDLEDLRFMSVLTRGNTSTFLVASSSTGEDKDYGNKIVRTPRRMCFLV